MSKISFITRLKPEERSNFAVALRKDFIDGGLPTNSAIANAIDVTVEDVVQVFESLQRGKLPKVKTTLSRMIDYVDAHQGQIAEQIVNASSTSRSA